MIALLLAITSVSCLDQEQSELVQRLESIFYHPGFAKVPEEVFHVAGYGAVPDGTTASTKAIQQAIDAAAAAGGGVVIFDQGTYLSGALFVKSNVELFLDEGVTIRAIHDESAYPDLWTRVAGIEMYWPAALINIYKEKNARITGPGTIDGNGKFWWDKFWGDPPRSGGMWTEYNEKEIRWAVDYDCKRVRAVVVYGSEDVLLEDFTVLRSGFWTITMTYSSRVHVKGIVVRNNIGGYGPSSDGINTDSSTDILVEDCDIDCNDDNLCIKAGRDSDGLRVNRPSENIVYRNCTTRAGHGLITLGSETSGGIHNIEVYGLRAEGTNTGIRFKSARVRGGLIENIWFHDIEMDRVVFPFHFELDWYPSYSYPTIPEDFSPDSIPPHWIIMTAPVEPPERGIPEFRNLRISHVKATNASTAFHVNAFQEKPLADVEWDHIHIEAAEAGFIHNASNWRMNQVILEVPENEKIQMTGCREVDAPDYIYREGNIPHNDNPSGRKKLNLNQLLDSLGTGEGFSGIIAMGKDHQMIIPGDTLFCDTLYVVVNSEEQNEFTFFEPLGDGFYMTPVHIKIGDTGEEVAVSGERTHHWVFYLRGVDEPEKLANDADGWEYHSASGWIEIRKTGSIFRL